jgi:hypothetical protein
LDENLCAALLAKRRVRAASHQGQVQGAASIIIFIVITGAASHQGKLKVLFLTYSNFF